ncbi:hypothetical protein [Paraburkholderia sp. Cpub6]|uniref:hypothetical protein n=1 Tax=Paraburkholderia sp. Cpub6 TaxID=2723094 RepID=UPI0016177EC4|nr:hypothetical protein [Paraburkholderia sp. Cpub6]MBB5459516.1 hypothetical protein [Paraburkholderia sp. Cpub6]
MAAGLAANDWPIPAGFPKPYCATFAKCLPTRGNRLANIIRGNERQIGEARGLRLKT